MREKADKLWRWFADGAHFHVCGDVAKMAKDVDAALPDMAMRAGGLNEASARDWVAQLKQQKRYRRDVYEVQARAILPKATCLLIQDGSLLATIFQEK